jgi:hypothetical protein
MTLSFCIISQFKAEISFIGLPSSLIKPLKVSLTIFSSTPHKRIQKLPCAFFAVFNSRRGKKMCFVIIDILKYVSYYFLLFSVKKIWEMRRGETVFSSQSSFVRNLFFKHLCLFFLNTKRVKSAATTTRRQNQPKGFFFSSQTSFSKNNYCSK